MEFEFIETAVFTKKIHGILNDEDYSALQKRLIEKPDLGVVIPGGRGIRKLRWSIANKGKSGGIRILYYLYLSQHQIYMLYVFKKSEQSDLSREKLSELGKYLENYLE